MSGEHNNVVLVDCYFSKVIERVDFGARAQIVFALASEFICGFKHRLVFVTKPAVEKSVEKKV